MTIEHRTTRLVRQPPDIVHARLFQYAQEAKRELVPFKRGDRFGQLLGVTGDIGLDIRERDNQSIEVRTLHGRFRVTARANLEPTLDGETTMTTQIAVTPHGPMGHLMLAAARRFFPDFVGSLGKQVEEMATGLATELSKPDAEWNVSLSESRLGA